MFDFLLRRKIQTPATAAPYVLNTAHLDPVRKAVRSMEVQVPPHPWRRLGMFAVGGLRCIGFDSKSELLLTVSSNGRGVFDCSSGERVARDRGEYFEDDQRLEAQGIGPLANRMIRVSGLSGGGLPNITRDGWQLRVITLDWPLDEILLVEPGSDVYGPVHGYPSNMTKLAREAELRACGFSASGLSMVVATPSDVTIFTRAEAPNSDAASQLNSIA